MLKFIKIFWFFTLANFIERTMAKCGLILCAVEFTDIDKNLPGGENMGGIVQTLIYGLWDDVAAWPTEPNISGSVSLEQYATLTGDVTMKAGKRAFTFYSTEDTGKLDLQMVGETDGHSFETVLDMFNPGLKKKILGFVAAAKNDTLFFIAQDSEGQYYLLGDSKRGVKLRQGSGIGTGQATADRKGAGIQGVYKCNILRVYEGDVAGILEVAST
jgi:hypothetical protein